MLQPLNISSSKIFFDMDISVPVYFLSLSALLVVASFVMLLFIRLERKQKQKRKSAFYPRF